MAVSPSAPFRLDTQAWRVARARRFSRDAAYWIVLLVGAGLLIAVIGLGGKLIGRDSKPAVAAPVAATAIVAAKPKAPSVPAAKRTPVIVWNGFGGDGAASRAAKRLRKIGYPVIAIADAPRRDYRHSYVLFAPGARPSAERLARRLGLPPKKVVAPMEGIPRRKIGSAKVLVILARPV